MNKFSLATLNNFRDINNIKYLQSRIVKHYSGDAVVMKYLEGSLIEALMNFADRTEREDFMYSQPQTTVYGRSQNENITEQVACLNMRFMDYITSFIDDNIVFSKRHSQMTNTATWAVNDGLNASSHTIVQSMPRNKLCDANTSWIDEPNMKSLMPAQDQQYKAMQVREVTNDNKYIGAPNEALMEKLTASNPRRTVKTVEETLESWRYPTRGATVRDDPVGEIVRDRDAPKFRNQNEFPYGNSGLTSYKGNPGNSAPGFLDGSRPPPELARNPNETYQGEQAQKQLLALQNTIPYGYSYQSGVHVASAMPVHMQSHPQSHSQSHAHKCCDSGQCGLCGNSSREGYQTRPQIAMYFDNLGVGSGVYTKYSCAGRCRDYPRCNHAVRVSQGTHNLHTSTNFNNPNQISHVVVMQSRDQQYQGAKSGLLGEQAMQNIAQQHANGVIKLPGQGSKFVFDDSDDALFGPGIGTSSGVASQNIKTAPGNSLCAYAPANITVGDGYQFQGVDNDTSDRGTYEGKFSGDDDEYSQQHLDRLLSTKMIQSMNDQYGDKPVPDAVSSVYDKQAGRKKAVMNYGGSNNFTGGSFGGGGVKSASNPYHFSSDGVKFLRSEGFRGDMEKFDDKQGAVQHTGGATGVNANSRPHDGNNYVDMPQNNKKLWSNGFNFSDDTNSAEMQRLLNRRIFRSWAPGKYGEKGITTTGDSAQEQIPFWRKAVHARNYERDVDEAVGGFETDGMIRGYGKDMQELYCRIPNKYPCGDEF